MTARLVTVFMGTPAIAVPALQVLASLSDVRLVITQPDRVGGRGLQLSAPPIKQAAQSLGLDVWQPDGLRQQPLDPRLDCDLAVVMAYGELLRQPILDRPRAGCINLHASLLPRWRGASPLQAALRAGDAVSGITVMRMVRGLDAGPIYARHELAVPPDMTLPALHDAMAVLAAEALGRLLASWPPPPPVEQDEQAVTLCRKLTAADGHLDFHRPAAELERWVRAYTPSPGCWVMADGRRLSVLALEPRSGSSALTSGQVAVEEGELRVGTTDQAVAITRLQPAGKREMSGQDYVNGHPPPQRLS